MAITFDDIEIIPKKVRDGEGWRTKWTFIATAIDTENLDFKPITKEVSGYPTKVTEMVAMATELAGLFNDEILKQTDATAKLAEANTAIGGAEGIEAKLRTYLTENVGA